MRRTQDDIVARINALRREGGDFFGVQTHDLLLYLDFQHAKAFLVEGTTEAQWLEEQAKNKKSPTESIQSYMPFAVEKATGHRGLSAQLSLNHMRAWLWLDGNEDLLALVNDSANYTPYGAPCLVAIIEAYGITAVSSEQLITMASQGACSPDCEGGCRS
jgi:hypothetical protein